VASPRPCAFGRVVEGDWSWHVLMDLGPLPANSWKIGFGDAPAPAHSVHSFVFLTQAPKDATGLDRVRATLEVAWAWLDAGATALAFPSGGVAETAQNLKSIDPSGLQAEGAVGLMVSFAMMGKGGDGRTWLRPRGLSQFGLPDLCAAVSPQPSAAEVQATQLLFSSIAPYLVAKDQALTPGETVKIQGQVWQVAKASEMSTAPAFLGDLVYLRPAVLH